MSDVDAAGIPRKRLIQIVFESVARTVLGCLVIWTALSLVPERPDRTLALPIGMVLGGIVVYGWFFRREIRRIRRARYPMVVAGEAMVLVAVMFLAVFAAYYVVISESEPGSFTEPLNHFTAYYYALTVLATVGFGDITPVSTVARLVSMVQMGIDIAFLAVVIKLLTGTAQSARERRLERTQAVRTADADSAAPAGD